MRYLSYLVKLLWQQSSKVYRWSNLIIFVAPTVLATQQARDLQERLGIADPLQLTTGEAIWLTLLLILLSLVFLLARTAVSQEDQLTPKLQFSLKPKRGGIVVTPEKHTTEFRDGRVKVDEYTAIYIRALVRNTSRKTARKCSAYLVRVEKLKDGRTEQTAFLDPLQLAWSHVGQVELDVHHKVPRFVDLLKVKSTERILTFTAGWPLMLGDFFAEAATYRMTIVIAADDVATEATVDIVWNGEWDKVQILAV